MGVIRKYFEDHFTKHALDYERCYNSPAVNKLTSIEDKDVAFLDCHRKYIRSLRNQVGQELQDRAFQLLNE